MKIKEIMTKNPITILPTTSIKDAANQMLKHNIGALPVYDGKKLLGIVTDRDMAVRALAVGSDSSRTAVHTIMSRSCITCKPEDELDLAVNLMEQKSIRRMVVIDNQEADRPIGIFSLDDIARKSKDRNFSGNAFMQLNKNSRRIDYAPRN